MQKLIENNH